MQSSLRLSKIKSAGTSETAESRSPVLHAAFEEIEKRWGNDWSRVPETRKPYPQIPEWKVDHRIFSYMHKTQNS